MEKSSANKVKLIAKKVVLSNDFHIEETEILNMLWNIPTVKYLDGWIYKHYESKSINWSYAMINGDYDPKLYSNDFDTSTYKLKQVEIDYLNNGGFEEEMQKIFNSFHSDLRRFHLHFSNNADFAMLATYTKAIYYLKESHDYSPFSELYISAPDLNRNGLLTTLHNYIKELVCELEWRMSRLNPYNHYNFHMNDEELTMYYNSIFYRGFRLNDPSNFRKNYTEIVERLKPVFIDVNTSTNEISKLFSGRKVVFSSLIKWIAPKNALKYFLNELVNQQKISDTNIYVIASNIFIDKDGNKITELKGARSMPKTAKQIDELVELF